LNGLVSTALEQNKDLLIATAASRSSLVGILNPRDQFPSAAATPTRFVSG